MIRAGLAARAGRAVGSGLGRQDWLFRQLLGVVAGVVLLVGVEVNGRRDGGLGAFASLGPAELRKSMTFAWCRPGRGECPRRRLSLPY